jgi:hypothetical protein
MTVSYLECTSFAAVGIGKIITRFRRFQGFKVKSRNNGNDKINGNRNCNGKINGNWAKNGGAVRDLSTELQST